MGERRVSSDNVSWRHFVSVLLALVVVGIAVELVLPWFPPYLGQFRRLVFHPGDGTTTYALRPDVTVGFSGVFERIRPSVTWQVNGQGLRADAPVGAREQNFRIATYGDSETFGWSVDFADTYQQRMQDIDPRVEVLNFGVPGYNVDDVSRRIETTTGDYSPDMWIYLVNKNDVDAPLDISDPVLASELLLRLRFAYQMWKKPWRRQARTSSSDTRPSQKAWTALLGADETRIPPGRDSVHQRLQPGAQHKQQPEPQRPGMEHPTGQRQAAGEKTIGCDQRQPRRQQAQPARKTLLTALAALPGDQRRGIRGRTGIEHTGGLKLHQRVEQVVPVLSDPSDCPAWRCQACASVRRPSSSASIA